MKKSLLFIIVVIISLFTIGCNNETNKQENTNETNEVISSMKVTINDIEYTLYLADTKAAQQLVEYAPFEVTMKELNGNEKYVYLSDGFTVDSFKPTHIEKGDVMLFDNSCIVIFYKSFNTSGYSYTRLGHIDNLPDFDNNDVKVKFNK